MSNDPNPALLAGYLEEALAPDEMARIEEQLRTSDAWRDALASIRDQVDLGEHSVATIWRRHRLTCPSREKLGAYHMQGLVPEEADYIRFHLEVVKCRWCTANLEDLQMGRSENETETEVQSRRRRFFQTSVGMLRDSGPKKS